MPISGLVLTLNADPALAGEAVAQIRSHPSLTLGEPIQRWLPVSLEAVGAGTSRDLHDWISTLPGIDFVEVVYVNFDGDASSPNPGDAQ